MELFKYVLKAIPILKGSSKKILEQSNLTSSDQIETGSNLYKGEKKKID